MTIQERFNAPTSKFFKKVRNIGLAVASTGAAILAAPVSLPTILVTAAHYLLVAGGVASTISQATTEGRDHKDPANGKFVKRG